MRKCIVVEPEIEGNLGFLARTMANFDFEQLILVNPKTKIGKKAKNRAVHAQKVLENVLIKDSFEKALNCVDFSIGTTGLESVDSSNFVRSTTDVREIAERASEVSGDIGVVLGRESKGLTNEELSMCDMAVKVPTSDNYPVMNITHAACVVFYELFRAEKKGDREASSRKEKEYLKHIFKSIVNKMEYSESDADREVQCLQNFIGRSFVDKSEINTLIGVFKKIEKSLEVKK